MAGKNFAAGALALLLTLTVGCSPGKKAVSEPSVQPKPLSEPVALNAVVQAPPDHPFTQKIQKGIDKFQQDHPGVTVKIDFVVQSYYQTIKKQIDAGTPPDLFMVSPDTVEELDKANALTDLTPLLNANAKRKDGVYQPMLDVAMLNGKLLFVPLATNTNLIYYNKILFDKQSIPYPQPGWTWDDFANTAKKLTDQDPTAISPNYGLILPFEFYAAEPFVLMNGGSLLSPDGTKSKGYLDGPKSVQAFQQVFDLINLDKVTPKTADNSLFRESRAAMMLGGSFNYAETNAALLGHLGAAPIPAFKDGAEAYIIASNGFGVSSKSAHPQLAFDLLAFLMLEDNEFSKSLFDTGLLAVKSLIDKATPEQQMMVRQFEYGVLSSGTRNRRFAQLLAATMRKEKDTITSSADLAAKLSQWAEEIDRQLAQPEPSPAR